ncbi:MAG TPA: hypothetical protein VFV56_11130 [Gaiellaceae bacterium]|jgi:hypothetical protein|nr:hypothetical protein [Gaiellaceae bacterium]
MDGLRRVRFRFGSQIEDRYLLVVPEPGDFVGHGNQLWIAAFVSSDAEGVTVICWRNDGDGTNDLRDAV